MGAPIELGAEMAAELGYSDQAHFTRAFRRWTGESPSAYRRATETRGAVRVLRS